MCITTLLRIKPVFMMRIFTICLLALVIASCNRASTTLEPVISCPPHPKELQRETRSYLNLPSSFSVSPFPCLNVEELSHDWGKELKIAYSFAMDFDLFRAITCFKRALFLMPTEESARRLEIQYDIVLAYYLGKKYTEVIYDVETTALSCVTCEFAAYSDLLLILYDSYKNLCQNEKSEHIFKLIQEDAPQSAHRLLLLSAIEKGDLASIYAYNREYRYIEGLFNNYEKETKSIRKAENLNALLPGAGYWYVGQKQTALTAFLINAAFIAATAHFFDHGNIGAGIITLSLEGGWYFGGIYGAGLAAKLYNERLFETFSSKVTCQEKLFPMMMLRYTF